MSLLTNIHNKRVYKESAVKRNKQTKIPMSLKIKSPGSGVPANEDVEAELEALSWAV